MNANLERIRVYKEKWKPMDYVELQAYIGLLMLAGVYKSHNEAMENLWNERIVRLRLFKSISRVMRFDNRST